MDDHETLKLVYKRAKKAYKADRSNVDLKRAKLEAKEALMSENDVCSTATDENDESPAIHTSGNVVSSPEKCIQVDNCCVINVSDTEGDKGGSGVDDADGFNVNSEHNSADISQLEETYHLALAAFKSNKNDKELRRAKTAARRALDDAILLAASTTSDGTTRQLTCADCSKKFIYSMTDTAQTKQHKRKGRNDNNSSLPKRCQPCHSIRSNRLSINQNQRRIALDSRKRNMCYAFQKGECPHGSNCKFSHNPEHGGRGGKLLKAQSTDSSSK